MTREEAYAWVKRQGALVNFGGKDKEGKPAVLVQLEGENGIGPDLENAVHDLKTKASDRVKKHLARLE